MDGSSSFRILISLKLEGEGGGIAAAGEALTVAESSGCGWLVGWQQNEQPKKGEKMSRLFSLLLDGNK